MASRPVLNFHMEVNCRHILRLIKPPKMTFLWLYASSPDTLSLPPLRRTGRAHGIWLTSSLAPGPHLGSVSQGPKGGTSHALLAFSSSLGPSLRVDGLSPSFLQDECPHLHGLQEAEGRVQPCAWQTCLYPAALHCFLGKQADVTNSQSLDSRLPNSQFLEWPIY